MYVRITEKANTRDAKKILQQQKIMSVEGKYMDNKSKISCQKPKGSERRKTVITVSLEGIAEVGDGYGAEPWLSFHFKGQCF